MNYIQYVVTELLKWIDIFILVSNIIIQNFKSSLCRIYLECCMLNLNALKVKYRVVK
jgi:hypothetical protein